MAFRGGVHADSGLSDVINKGKKQHGQPSLHCPAATVRHLVPLMPILTAKHFAVGTDHEKACQRLAKFLAKVYSKVEANQISGLAQNSAKVAAQYMALEKEAMRGEDAIHWHIMPKLHMFQHICDCNCPPKNFMKLGRTLVPALSAKRWYKQSWPKPCSSLGEMAKHNPPLSSCC